VVERLKAGTPETIENIVRLAPRWCLTPLASTALLLTVACDPSQPFTSNEPSFAPAPSTAALSSYFPPSEAAGGWRKTTDATKILSLGVDAGKLAGLGSYLMSLPYENYGTGVSGYSASNKAAIVIKNGWIVGEYYNQASAATGVYYLASNGKTFTLLLAGRMARDYPQHGFGLGSKLYDQRWLSQGFPLTDTRKADITFDQVFRHASGIIPEVEDPVANSSVRPEANWDFASTTVGKDPDYPVTAPLYFPPGSPSTYTNGSTYSSVAFNHFSLIFRNVTGLEASAYLRQAILDPIGAGRMAYKLTSGMGDYVWATAGNGLASARDFARLGYLMLHEGRWGSTEIFEAAWLRQFTTAPAYRNIRSNVDCRWGNKFPSDMYRTTGSGQNWALVVPSLDLVLTFNGRTPKSFAAAIDTTSLNKLFAAVTERYVACDGTVVAITLTATGREDATKQYMNLRWAGASSARIDIYRNGAFISNTPNDGRQTVSRKFTRRATYVMKVCEAGTSVCSNEVTLVFE
jgi:CubicO group peptidase (beta-lactamase class C family)